MITARASRGRFSPHERRGSRAAGEPARRRRGGARARGAAFLLADWFGTPEDQLLAGEARAVLQRALDALPAHYRAVLVLRDVEELSNEQVAEIMGESVASVKSRLHRARMALREQLTRHRGPTA